MHELTDLPSYPKFRGIDPTKDKTWYDDFYANLSPYADISFGNLLVWLNLNNDLSLSALQGNVVLRYTSPFDQNFVYTLIGNHVTDRTIAAMQREADRNKLTLQLKELPETTVLRLSKKKYAFSEDRDGFEYIISVKEQARLSGRRFSRQRNQLVYFNRQHKHEKITFQLITFISPFQQEKIYNTITEWGLTHDKKAVKKNQNFEAKALQNSLNHFNNLASRLLIVYIDGRSVAYCFYRLLDGGRYITVNHLKVDHTLKYMFDFTVHYLAIILYRSGVVFINFEQDMGLPGLRRHKQLMRPVRLLKKYSLSLTPVEH